MSGRRYGGPNGYGHKPDPAGHRVTSARRLLAAALVTLGSTQLPDHASLQSCVLAGPGILFQMRTSSCVGHAIVGAVETRIAFLVERNLPAPKLDGHLAPLGAYDVARCVDRHPDPTTNSLPPLVDEGSEPNQAFRGIAEWGICPFGVRPTVEAMVNRDPDLLEIETGAKQLVRGPFAIPNDSRKGDHVAAAIVAGYPVCVATEVDSPFENYSGGTVLGPIDPGDDLGGHYIYIVGYRTNSAGKREYQIANSWDVSWGENGFAWMSEEWLAQTIDCYIVDLEDAA